MNTLHSFLSMGGYAGFVWTSYGAMIIIFAYSIVTPLRRFRRIKTQLRGKY